jgi:hypothetical protein
MTNTEKHEYLPLPVFVKYRKSPKERARRASERRKERLTAIAILIGIFAAITYVLTHLIRYFTAG